MALESLKAGPHPDGNRIDLSWKLPAGSGYSGARVVRREGSYPVSPDDGVNVAQADGLESTTDSGLQAGKVYYYMLFPYQGAAPVFEVDLKNRVSALATSPEDFAGYMFDLLPAIYHRYDRDTGALARFLQLPGGQLDQLHSFAKAALDFKDITRINGDLLPLLAQWIGWKTDHKLEFSGQRTEIRHAPSIYKTIGLIPTVEATTKRISQWESRTKEFVHNIFASNRPEHLNIWSMVRDNSDTWSDPPRLLSLDFAYEGRPGTAIDNNGIRWLFYHTRRKDKWEIWYKTSPYVTIASGLLDQLSDGPITIPLLQALETAGLSITTAAAIATLSADKIWRITDGADNYIIEKHYHGLVVYEISGELTALAPSRPLIVGNSYLYKYPSVALQDQNPWLFWSAYNETQQHWRIQYRSRNDAQWSDTGPAQPDPLLDIDRNPFAVAGVYDDTPQRRSPYAIVDGDERLWLFWLENSGSGWQLRYNRHDGVNWGTPITFPNPGVAPRVSTDLTVLIQPTLPDQRIYLFWARKAETSTPGQIRWEIAYRVKQDLDLNDANWSPVQSLPKHAVDDNHHDKEPSAILNGVNVELFWSSNREDTGWSIWRSVLTDHTTNSWDAAETERLTQGAYSQRDPLAIPAGDETWLVYRSNRGISYESQVYGATGTFDERYAGSTSMDVRQAQKLALRKKFEDIQRYTYDTGKDGERGNDDWIARDTIGAYLDNDTLSAEEIEAGIARLRPVLQEFMPITDRAVFISSSVLHTEYVYTYGLPVSSASHYITSTYNNEFTGVLSVSGLGEGEDFSDSLDS